MLNAEGVGAGRDEAVDRDGVLLAGRPTIDDELVIDPDAHAVVHGGGEAVVTGSQGDVARPADGEVIVADAGIRRATPPTEVDGAIPTGHDGGAA